MGMSHGVQSSESTLSASRREAIKLGLAALGGLGISALAPARAYASGTMEYGVANEAGAEKTGLASHNPDCTLEVTNSVGGGLVVHTSGASGQAGTAIGATTDSSTESVISAAHYGQYGSAVNAHIVDTGNTAPAIYGETPAEDDSAVAIEGVLTKDTAKGCAVKGYVNSYEGGIGVWGRVGPDGIGDAVYALNEGTGANDGLIGYAVRAQGTNALRVEGRMTMSRSGKAYIARGESYVTVKPAYTLSENVSIFCTLQDSAGTGIVIRYAQRTNSTQFKIVLNKACTSSVKVAYMILG